MHLIINSIYIYEDSKKRKTLWINGSTSDEPDDIDDFAFDITAKEFKYDVALFLHTKYGNNRTNATFAMAKEALEKIFCGRKKRAGPTFDDFCKQHNIVK